MIKIKNLEKYFLNKKILNKISTTIDEGKVYAIIGPSGSGKSTFLKCVAGIDEDYIGNIEYNNLEKKDLGFIFQNFNLFTNKSVLENLIYAPCKILNKDKSQAIEEAKIQLKKVNIDSDLYNQYPKNLSGGQKQRVAIARTLCMEPKVLFYDEPTSALDPENTVDILKIITSLSKNKKITNVIVTHQMKFAEHIADEVIFFDNGNIAEKSDAKTFFSNPKNDRSKNFLKKTQFIYEV
ncbi:MAG: ABC-type polar amino acid transport system ATPase subunit [Candidatus Midichloriaceae bacterium]|jgi:ABC-type polar amino acid transport system ATPase subunit